jgi:hypothetical protein
MTFTVRLERARRDAGRAPSIVTTVTNRRTGDPIPIAAGRSLRVVAIVGHRAAWTLKTAVVNGQHTRQLNSGGPSARTWETMRRR